MLLDRAERLELRVLVLVERARFGHLDGAVHDGRADETAERSPGKLVDALIRIPERMVGGGEERLEGPHGGGEFLRVHGGDEISEPVVAGVAPGIDLPAGNDELPRRGQEGERLARATILGEAVPHLHPALQQILLAEIGSEAGRNVGQLTAHRRVALFRWRERRVLGRGGLGLGDGSGRWRCHGGRRSEREVGGDAGGGERQADEQERRTLLRSVLGHDGTLS